MSNLVVHYNEIREPKRLKNPLVKDYDLLQLPTNCIVHYLTDGDTPFKPLTKLTSYRTTTPYLIYNEKGLKGMPHRPVRETVDHFTKTHSDCTFKHVSTNPLAISDLKGRYILNYDSLKHTLNERDRDRIAQQKKARILDLFLERLVQSSKLNVPSYYIIELDNVKYDEKTQNYLKHIDDKQLFSKGLSYSKLVLLDLYRSTNVNDTATRLGKLTPEQASRLNFILKFNTHYVILNLGWLHNLNKDKTYSPTIGKNIPPRSRKDSKVLNKQLMSFLNGISEATVTKEYDDQDVEKLDILEEELNDTLIPTTKPTYVNKTYNEPIPKIETFNENKLNYLLKVGLIDEKTHRDTVSKLGKWRDIKSPDDPTIRLDDLTAIKPDELILKGDKLPKIKGVTKASMLKSSLFNDNTQYIEELLEKDMVNTISHIQRGGWVLEGYSKQHVKSVKDNYMLYKVRYKPIQGEATTLTIQLPVVDEDGVFMNNGNLSRMRKQTVDMPLRKIGPENVVISSAVSKIFVQRGIRKANNYAVWLKKTVNQTSLKYENYSLNPTPVFDNNFKQQGRHYSALAKSFDWIETSDDTRLTFNHKTRQTLTTKDITKPEKKYGTFIGVTNNGGQLLFLNNDGVVTYLNENNNVDKKHLTDVLRFDTHSLTEYATVKLMGRNIPVIIILATLKGLSYCIEHFARDVTVKPVGEEYVLKPDQYAITFKDYHLIFNRINFQEELLFSGLAAYNKTNLNYNVAHYDTPEGLLGILNTLNVEARGLVKIETYNELFIDPISRDLLITMGEPHEFIPLLVRAVELLTFDYHEDPNSELMSRVRGYERLPSIAYKELFKSVEDYKNRKAKRRQKPEMKPNATWLTIMQDPCVELERDINPFQNIKSKEVVTMVGEGGRSKDAIPEELRAVHKTQKGIYSEATVDSSDVGIVKYLTNDPDFKTLRGQGQKWDDNPETANRLISTSNMKNPFSTQDDPKRANMATIMESHVIAPKSGYESPIVRTGAEKTIPYRVNKIHARHAKGKGVVKEVSDKGLVVEYEDGTTEDVFLGRHYGSFEGSNYIHDITTSLKVGDKVEPYDALAYNKSYFKPDPHDPAKLIYLPYLTATMAYTEERITWEDSVTVSTALTKRLKTHKIYERNIQVPADYTIRKIVKVGQSLKPDDVLMYIESSAISTLEMFDKETSDLIKHRASDKPTAKYLATVDRIEARYNAPLEDLSPQLRKVVEQADIELKERTKDKTLTGFVDSRYRTKGQPLPPNTVELKIFLVKDIPINTVDKLVISHQLKATIAEVYPDNVEAEDGTKIDLRFGGRSDAARIVNSAKLLGMSVFICKKFSKITSSNYLK